MVINNNLKFGHIGNYNYATWIDSDNIFYIQYVAYKGSNLENYFQIWIRL